MTPVFIGGCDRSGTTFLGSLLGAHSQCLTTPEAQFVIELLPFVEKQSNSDDALFLANMIANHWRFKLWGVDVDLAQLPIESQRSYADLIQWFVKQYGQQVGKPASDFWIDHTPSNTRYAVTLLEMFPEAKIIHIVRDGRAMAASIMDSDWGPKTARNAALFWAQNISFGLAAESFLSDRIVRVRYEDIVCEPEKTLTELCAFIGISYQPAMAKGGGFKPPSYTVKHHALVDKPPNRDRLNAWQKKLSPREIELFENVTGDLLRCLGYPLTYSGQANKITQREKVLEAFQEGFHKYIAKRWRRHRRRSQVVRTNGH